ncbi:MAG TPA: hypothetical protein VLK57_18625 [Pseudonocardia sp.]|nr:hypothetical protein [Pseudonocardia sp.]
MPPGAESSSAGSSRSPARTSSTITSAAGAQRAGDPSKNAAAGSACTNASMAKARSKPVRSSGSAVKSATTKRTSPSSGPPLAA